ncbi:unnamed protein product [Notodromas monacha]|uniref:Ras-specific guanine nucleotide-releasing factor RalGPS1 n=1 Tax=Notodromas monacha TaxID=399045 RepID=A0A7R9GFI2_9CRUS|nr:unnamed protein product [Notodromas monacha]CAG0920802.1 unnamed protein product [Notodromas monacha]
MSDATLLLSHFAENSQFGNAPTTAKEPVWMIEWNMIRSRFPVYSALNSGFDASDASCATGSLSEMDDDQGNSIISGDSLEDVSCSSKMALVVERPSHNGTKHVKSRSVQLSMTGSAAVESIFKPSSLSDSSCERSATPVSSSSNSSSCKAVNYVKIPKHSTLCSPNSRTEIDFGRLVLNDRSKTLPARSGSSETIHMMDILAVPPDVIAEQLTLMDFNLYSAIKEEELYSCGWADQKYKHAKAPNVMNFIERFNQTAYWVSVEVLERENTEMRAKVICHLLKTCRHLKALQNLNSEAAVVSALRNAAIFRLNKTWALVPSKEKVNLAQRSEFLLEKGRFRIFLEEAVPPCIPFLGELRWNTFSFKLHDLEYSKCNCFAVLLGPFLTELITIKEAYRDADGSNGTSLESRKRKMDEVLHGVLRFQSSTYEKLKCVGVLQRYINSRKYIDALFKFTEDELYNCRTSTSIPPFDFIPRRSLSLEPGESPSRSKGTAGDGNLTVVSPTKAYHPSRTAVARQTASSLSPVPRNAKMHQNRPSSARVNAGKFPFTHRKAQSLGTNIFREGNSYPPLSNGSKSLLDSELSTRATIEETCEGSESPEPLSGGDFMPVACVEGVAVKIEEKSPSSDDTNVDRKTASLASQRTLTATASSTCSGSHDFWYGSVVQRKTVKKNHKKVRWTKQKDFWMELHGCRLYIYSHRLLGNKCTRNGYRADPWKNINIVGSKIAVTSPNSFVLSHQDSGNEWYFAIDCPERAEEWVSMLRRASLPCDIPENLMEF